MSGTLPGWPGPTGAAGHLVPDAVLAALARTHSGRIATADRGFARFPDVRTVDPAA